MSNTFNGEAPLSSIVIQCYIHDAFIPQRSRYLPAASIQLSQKIPASSKLTALEVPLRNKSVCDIYFIISDMAGLEK